MAFFGTNKDFPPEDSRLHGGNHQAFNGTTGKWAIALGVAGAAFATAYPLLRRRWHDKAARNGADRTDADSTDGMKDGANDRENVRNFGANPGVETFPL